MSYEVNITRVSPSGGGALAPRIDIVFVHGLQGDPKRTWTAEDAAGAARFWPEWVARDLPGAAVWCLGYPTTVNRWVGRSMPLHDLAVSVLDRLLTKDIGVDRPLVFVGHSMGGLVIKEMLLESEASSQPRWQTLSARTEAVMFLGTPHTGSDLPALGNFVEGAVIGALGAGAGAVTGITGAGAVFGLLTKWLGRKQTSADELQRNLPMLRKLNRDFRQYVQKRHDRHAPLQISVYYETQPTWGVQVVTEDSADPGLAQADLVALPTDHLGVCKFADEDAQVVLRLKQVVRQVAGLTATPAVPPVTAPPGGAPAAPDGPHSMRLAFAEQGIGDAAAAVWVGACVVSEAPEQLAERIEGWKNDVLGDPLLAEATRQRLRKADLTGLLAETAVWPRLLDALATEPFQGYVYYARRDGAADLAPDELAKRLRVRPLADRLRKKTLAAAWAQGSQADFATALAQAAASVRAEPGRGDLATPPVAASGDRPARALLELASLLATVTARHLADPADAQATVLFQHLRSGIKFATDVVGGAVHTRDRNPLP